MNQTSQNSDRLWWLETVPDASSAPAEAREAWDRAKAKLGFVPNVQRLYALRPERYLRWLAHYEQVMRGPSGLSPTEREMIAVVVSSLNDCHYCVTSHSAYLRVLTGDPTLPDRLRADPDAAAPDERTRAILRFVTKVTQDAHGCTPDDLAVLRRVGLSDEEIFDAVETAATFNFTNRLTSALGMVPNAEFEAMGR